MAEVRTGDLGWTAGQNISSLFPSQIATMSSGDVLVLDHMYDLAGGITQLPDNFTLAAGAAGAGINFTDTGTNINENIRLGNNNTLLDFTGTASNAPNTGYTGKNPASGTDYHSTFTIVAISKNNVTVRNCVFSGHILSHVDIRGGSDHLIEDTTFNDGFYQVRIGGEVLRPTWRRVLFQNAMGDGIKTILGGSAGHIQNALVDTCVFLHQNRDGIDTTGGFKDSTIQNSYFVDLGVAGIDAKMLYQSSEDFNAGESVSNRITVNNSEFTDCADAAIVITTEDRNTPEVLNSGNVNTWAVKDFNLNNSLVERYSFTGKAFLVKDSRDIFWNNLETRGTIEVAREVSNYTWGLPQNVTGTSFQGTDRTIPADSFYQALAGHDHSSLSYGGGGSPAIPVIPASGVSAVVIVP